MKELGKDELQEVQGGFLWLLIGIGGAIAVQTVLVGFLAAGIVGSFDAGYKSEIDKKE